MAGGAGEPSAKRAKVEEAKEEEDPLVRRKEEVVRLLEESSAKGKGNARAKKELLTLCEKLKAKNEKRFRRLPPEMWQKILDENVQQKDLFALAVTCRFFRDTSDVVGLARAKRLSGTLEGPTPIMRDIEFTLYIETSNTAPQAGMLLNRFEEADSVITQLHAGPIRKIDRSHSELVELSADEKAQPGFIGKILTLESIWKNDEGHIVDTTRCVYEKSKGFFTVAEVVASVEAYERIDRPKNKWFGGVDCHHVFFEGLFPNANKDAYGIFWGS